ncbi:hypothetical protein CR513_58697, partial [Mucuna pruriens]
MGLQKGKIVSYHPSSRWVLVSKDVTFHETYSFFRESYQEVESVIELLSFPSWDVQVQEVMKPILVPQQEALKDENWIQAMKEEMKALDKNSTRGIGDRPKAKSDVGCRWIYTMKCKYDGNLDRYKARLFTKGYIQSYEIDYEETFTLGAKMNTIRVILPLAAHFDLEEVYIEIPPGFYSHNEKNKSQDNHTLFIKHSPDDKLTLLLVYVDDMIVIGDDEIEN